MNIPKPALVTQRAAQRIPRLALLLFCAAYVLPGLFGRDPWRNADVAAFGVMASIAEGRSPWWAPQVGGLAADAALLPYWMGAASIRLLSPWIDAALAARIPFALLLTLALVCTWYATYHLARTDSAQPLPFAFGGEADPVDYARAIADGALLAMIATLGLLQLGHETTPELSQLVAVTLFLYALAASLYRGWKPRLAVLVALPMIAASGAPGMALGFAAAGTLVCTRSGHPLVRRYAVWVVLSGALAVLTGWALGAWEWRLSGIGGSDRWASVLRLFAWFLWPVWPLALWTLWRWRSYLFKRHISVPLGVAVVSVISALAMGGFDRALLLSIPALAILAAFALPTLQRATAAAIDWFSVFFFTGCAVVIWVVYVSMQTGVPAKPAANVIRLAPGFEPSFSSVALLFAVLGTGGWMWLVVWRTGRHRHPLWKSMVLPASGVALCWLLLMTLWLPPLDYARSHRPLIERIAEHVPPNACLVTPGLSRALLASLEQFGGYRVTVEAPSTSTPCDHLVRHERPEGRTAAPDGWSLVAVVQRPTDREAVIGIYRRQAQAPDGGR